jgi:hypothetical protein
MKGSPTICSCILLFGSWILASAGPPEHLAEIASNPPQLVLDGPGVRYHLLVEARDDSGCPVDLTSAAHYRSLNPGIASVTPTGAVHAVADGETAIVAEVGGHRVKVPVRVVGSSRTRRFDFENDIIPILSRFGCNSSGCHGKAEGQNGFKLSVFGFDPGADYDTLVKEARGRRVFPAAPEHSLFLKKISGVIPHGGGVRIPRGAEEYGLLRDWVAAGVPFGDGSSPRVAALRVDPHERRLVPGGRQQLRVVARYSDGREADVTDYCKFQSNNDALGSVSDSGLVAAGDNPGDFAVMVAFMGWVDVFRAVIPLPHQAGAYPKVPEFNFIDGFVAAKLRRLNIVPSEVAGDAEFLRRVYLDVIGTLPAPAESRRFLGDPRPDRRTRLVDELLQRPEFSDYWALKWADLLRVDRQALGHKRAYAFYRWIRDSLAANKPLDQFAREVLTAEGPLDEEGPASFYKVVSKPGEVASTLSQVFLGVRIACAECHHHPFDRWSQADYYGMQAFFTQVGVRPAGPEEDLVLAGDVPTRNPRTRETVLAHALGTPAPAFSPAGDRRQFLADWMTAPANPWFARNLANRTWAHFLGRGLIEPDDDVRATNPPTNPELLDALARHLAASRFDFRELVRTIIASRTYQLSSHPNPSNERDEQNYSRALFKRLDAEVLLDMVCQTTGVAEKFPGVPAGYRAIQLWDSKVPHYFLRLFGRPVRATACECERTKDPGVSQVLHFLNSPEIHNKLTHDAGFVAQAVREKTDDGALVEELYLNFYSRPPSAHEREVALVYLRRNPAGRRAAAEDLAWGLMNSLEFVFNH